jgi:RNA polymerase sigma factor (sigma-70 family)
LADGNFDVDYQKTGETQTMLRDTAGPTANGKDSEWVHLLKQEPPDAAVLDSVWQDIYRFCYDQIAGYGLDEQLAQDAACDALRRLLRSLKLPQGGFRGECSLRSYWRTIATRCVKTLATKEFKRQRRQLLLSTVDELEAPDGHAFIDVRAGQDLILQRLLPYLEQLPPRQRSVIVLRYLTPDSNGEFVENPPEVVATMLGISRAAVNVAAAHARRQLRQHLQSCGYHDADDLLCC